MKFNIETFLFDTPLYSKITVNDNDEENQELVALMNSDINRPLEGYNPIEKIETTFVVTTNLLKFGDKYLEYGGINTVKIKCKRTESQFWFFIYWDPEDREILKIGQLPSVADIHISEIKQYKKLLTDEKLKEFTRAIGLAANGVGIGSFVYLRRIFESLIIDTYVNNKDTLEISEKDFRSARMDEKIEILKANLPTFLIENQEIYAILSLGIHELDEKSCLYHFDALRVGIEIILDEQLDELRKKEKIENARKKIRKINSEVKKK